MGAAIGELSKTSECDPIISAGLLYFLAPICIMCIVVLNKNI